jgi:ABC-type transport system involved in multi-copper enzyme maturation permease subunit
MIKIFFIKELQAALINGRLILSCFLLTVLMLVGGIVSERQYVSLKSEQEEMRRENREAFELNNSKRVEPIKKSLLQLDETELTKYQPLFSEMLRTTLYDLTTIKQRLTKYPSLLSFISQNNKTLPNGIEMDYFRMSIPEKFDSANNYIRSFVVLDWSNIIIYLFSFVCLCFAYDGFSGEKEKGTLKLMLSNSIPRWKIVSGKLLSLWFILSIPLLLGVILNLLYFQLSPNIILSATDYGKISIFVVFSVLIIGINVLLFLGISLVSKNSSVSSISCLLVWIVFVFIIPNTSWLMTNKISPVPAIDEQNRKEELLIKDVKEETWSSLWEGHPPTENVYKYKEMCDRKDEIHKNIWNEYIDRVFYQTNLNINISKISPFFIFKWLNDRISDNNYYGYRNLHSQVSTYQKSFQRFVSDMDASDKNSYHLIWSSYEPYGYCNAFMSNKVINIEEIPVFNYTFPDIKTTVKQGGNEIILLFAWIVFLFVGVFFIFYRYDVR